MQSIGKLLLSMWCSFIQSFIHLFS